MITIELENDEVAALWFACVSAEDQGLSGRGPGYTAFGRAKDKLDGAFNQIDSIEPVESA